VWSYDFVSAKTHDGRTLRLLVLIDEYTRECLAIRYCESFKGKLRDECWNGEIFYSLKDAQVVIENWRVEHNTVRPHSALGYGPPAPAAFAPRLAALRSPSAPCDPPIANPFQSEVVL
jgi:transposase InsO family protein